jgi:putative membrane protein
VVVALVGGVDVRVPDTPLVGDGSHDRLAVYLLSGLVILLLNMTVRPVLHLIGLPVTILTLGLFALVINALVFALAARVTEALGMGLVIDGFGAAFWGAIIMSVVNWLLGPVVGMLRMRHDFST